jgi:hypothetical protein
MGTGSKTYEIRVQGRLDPEWAADFVGIEVVRGVEDETILRGWIADQAALHGLLARLRDLNLPLISVKRIEELKREKENA